MHGNISRLDLKCGKGSISPGEKCHKGAATKVAAIAAGALVASGITAAAVNRRPPKIRHLKVTPPSASSASPKPSAPSGPPRLPGSTPYGLLPPARRPKSKTQRMRENTAASVRNAEAAIGRTAQAEVTRIAQIGNTMAATGEATGMAFKTTLRELRLRTEAARRRYEPGYRSMRRQAQRPPAQLPEGGTTEFQVPLNPPQSLTPERIRTQRDLRTGQPRRRKPQGFGRSDAAAHPLYGTTYIDPARPRGDAEGDGKKYTKTVTNPETGRKNKVRYGAKGYKIAPGTDKGDRYCARSFGDMKSHNKNCAGKDRNTPLCLSRAKWKCSGKTSRRDEGLTPGKPCGASHIPKSHKCSKGTGLPTSNNSQTAAKVALSAGLLAGGLVLAKKFRGPFKPPVTRDELRAQGAAAAAKPKISPENNDRIIREALEANNKADWQEDINTRRQAEINAACRGDSLGKTLPPLKLDAWINPTRCRAFGGGGQFGSYFIHPSQKYGVKTVTDPDNDWVADREWEMLQQVRGLGVGAPEPLAFRGNNVITMEHMKGYQSVAKQFTTYGNAPLKLRLDVIRNLSKLNVEGIAHGDAHEGNVLWNPKTRKTAFIDFGFATTIDEWSGSTPHGRSGVENLTWDMERASERMIKSDPGPYFYESRYRLQKFQQKWDEPLAFISSAAEAYADGREPELWRSAQRTIKRYYIDLSREVVRTEGYRPRVRSRLVRADGPSTEYYRTHPEAAAKKVRHQAEINRRPEERKRRAALNKERRRRGIDGKGGPDVSHTVAGKTVLEDPSTNRARNGHGSRPRLKQDSVWAEGFHPFNP